MKKIVLFGIVLIVLAPILWFLSIFAIFTGLIAYGTAVEVK